MSFSKTIARKIIFPAVVSIGLEKLISLFSKKKFAILMYHGVVHKTDFVLSKNHISISDFEAHCNYIKKNFRVIPLRQMFDDYRNNKNYNDLTVALTFDDGYENNLSNALPILEKYKFPATIFVTTKPLQSAGEILWYDLLDMTKNEIDFQNLKKIDLSLPQEKKNILSNCNTLDELKSCLKLLSPHEKTIVFDRLLNHHSIENAKNKISKEFWQMLDDASLKKLSSSTLIEIGSHTHNHPNLDILSEDEIIFELKESKKLLEEKIGQEVISIAFPDGSYNEKVKELSQKAGYENLLAVDYRLPDDKPDKNILPRFCIMNTTTPESNFIQLRSYFTLS